MSVIIPTGFAQSTLKFESAVFRQGYADLVLGFDLGGGTIGDLNSALEDTFSTFYGPIMSIEINLTSIRTVTATTLAEIITNIQGEVTDSMSPPNVCALVRKVVGVRGPGNAGRMFLPGVLTDAGVDDSGNLSSDLRATIGNAIQNIGLAVQALGFSLVILHQEGSTLAPTEVVDTNCELKVATQRRRVRKGSGRRSS